MPGESFKPGKCRVPSSSVSFLKAVKAVICVKIKWDVNLQVSVNYSCHLVPAFCISASLKLIKHI